MSTFAKTLADAVVQAIATTCPVATGERAREVAEAAIQQVLDSQPQERGEAVAWQYRLNAGSGWVLVNESIADAARTEGYEVRPLYAHPTPDAGRVAELEKEKAQSWHLADALSRKIEELIAAENQCSYYKAQYTRAEQIRKEACEANVKAQADMLWAKDELAESRERLRPLRLWHWQQALYFRRRADRAANIGRASEIVIDALNDQANENLRFVQVLNDFFPVGDTAEADGHVRNARALLTPAIADQSDYPECSGDPANCPENEGRGCCKPNPPAIANQEASAELCPNCDSPLPEGCGGVFKRDGDSCPLNKETDQK